MKSKTLEWQTIKTEYASSTSHRVATPFLLSLPENSKSPWKETTLWDESFGQFVRQVLFFWIIWSVERNSKRLWRPSPCIGLVLSMNGKLTTMIWPRIYMLVWMNGVRSRLERICLKKIWKQWMMGKGNSWSIWRRKPSISLRRKTKCNQIFYFILVCYLEHVVSVYMLKVCMDKEISIFHSL